MEVSEILLNFFTFILIFICPPLACYIMKPFGFKQKEMELTFPSEFRNKLLIVNIILTFCLFLPGVVHALYHFIEMQKLVE